MCLFDDYNRCAFVSDCEVPNSAQESLVNLVKMEPSTQELRVDPLKVEPCTHDLRVNPVKEESIAIDQESWSGSMSGSCVSTNNLQLFEQLRQVATSIKSETIESFEHEPLVNSECMASEYHAPFINHKASCPVITLNQMIYSHDSGTLSDNCEDSLSQVPSRAGHVMTMIKTEGVGDQSCPLHDHHNAISEDTGQVPVNVKREQLLDEIYNVDFVKKIKCEPADVGSSANDSTDSETEFPEKSYQNSNSEFIRMDNTPKRISQTKLSAHSTRTPRKNSSKRKQSKKSAKTTWECPVCDKYLSSECGLQDHIRVHTGEKPYQCPECDKCFAQSSHLRRHTLVHTGEKPHECTICSKCFTQPGDLKEHHRIHTGKKLQCLHCEHSCIRSSSLRRHTKSHHHHDHAGAEDDKCQPTKLKKLKTCSICDKSFYTGSDLNRHRLTHTRSKPHICPVCGQGFSQSGHMKVHLRSHTGETPYMCQECHKGFRRSTHLKSHMATHMREKPHKCDICNKAYGTPQGLTSHYQAKCHLRRLTKQEALSCSLLAENGL